MSMKSWKKRYYPVPAENIKKRDKLGAIEHCIMKWKGLRPKALEKHGLAKITGSANIENMFDPYSKFFVDDTTCALCHVSNSECDQCPIYKANNGKDCMSTFPASGLTMSAFSTWRTSADPEAMLKMLKKARKMYQEKS